MSKKKIVKEQNPLPSPTILAMMLGVEIVKLHLEIMEMNARIEKLEKKVKA